MLANEVNNGTSEPQFLVNNNAEVKVVLIGEEKTPIIIIEKLSASVNELLDFAGETSSFVEADGFYPGIRKSLPHLYMNNICAKYLATIQQVYQLDDTTQPSIVLSALSIAVTPENQLRPIQTLPHFDTTAATQFALVHYLCEPHHGGTSFYRHKETNYESITEQRLTKYGKLLKQQAIACQLHKNKHYMNGDNELFALNHRVNAKMNRAIIYPSNLLHSGNIHPEQGLSKEPKQGRLTTSSFFIVQ